ncbi:unnamed protein product [Cunninghamella blakesleeana]
MLILYGTCFIFAFTVKCNFAHPSCTRCAQAKATCSYEGSSTQVDIFNIVKLNDLVNSLQERVQTLESTMSNNNDDDNQTTSTSMDEDDKVPKSVQTQNSSPSSTSTQNVKKINQLTSSSSSKDSSDNNNKHKWTLSLTPNGLRIDTNIVSLPNLYDILLSGVSQLDLDADVSESNSNVSSPSLALSPNVSSSTNSSSSSSNLSTRKQIQHQRKTSLTNKTILTRKTPLWRSRISNFPLYNAWSSKPEDMNTSSSSSKSSPHLPITTDPSICQKMIDIYEECFICVPDIGCEGDTVYDRYLADKLDPFLMNAIFAWSARHGAIYHGLFPGYDPAHVGEYYCHVAKELLKDRFMVPSIDTLHGLLLLYIYSTNNPSGIDIPKNAYKQRQHQQKLESESYIYLGLAIRMCLDLKLHKEWNGTQTDINNNPTDKMDDDDRKNNGNEDDINNNSDNNNVKVNNNNNHENKKMIITKERYRRFFWALYFLETLCALHSERPFSLPPEDQISVGFPERLECEVGEQRWRTEYIINRFSITRIYRNIIQRTSQDKLLLSSIAELDANLEEWFHQLPTYLQYKQGDYLTKNWCSTSFREQACVKLNFEYHFQRCQLYAIFLNQQNDNKYNSSNNENQYEDEIQDEDMDEKDATEKSMELMAKDICINSAKMIAEILHCWKQLQQRWCHFSVESLLLATHIFKILLNDKDYTNLAKEHLMIMLSILDKSPIRNHRYAVYLMGFIKNSLYPNDTYQYVSTFNNNNNNDNDNNNISNNNHCHHQQHSNQYINNNNTMIQHHFNNEDNENNNANNNNNNNNNITNNNNNNNNINVSINQSNMSYKSLNNQQSLSPASTPGEYYTYRMQKLNGMIGSSLNDLPFSDFLYNPVINIPSPFGPVLTSPINNTTSTQTPSISSSSSTIHMNQHSILSNSYPISSSSPTIANTSLLSSASLSSASSSSVPSTNILANQNINSSYPALPNSTLTSLNQSTYQQNDYN